MAPSVWTLLLLVGAAWAQGHTPASVRKEKLPDWKRVVRSSRDSSIITQCDFEDDSKPFCDWAQLATDDGDWTRTSGPSLNGTTGPPGGYPNREGYYLHMDSSAFHQGGVAALSSPPIWEQGPLCVHFAYHMFGLSWGAQLKLLLHKGTESKHPNLLWKHVNAQNPSWLPTAVTVPMGLVPPSQLVFEGVRGNTAYLDIALDAITIHRGSCHQVCVMQACSFDTLNDLCGWSWIPTTSGAKWVQKNGSSGVPNVGPQDDFSKPGSGFYMLLDPKNAKPNQKSVLLSPLSQSSGCLSLSFYYILHGQSPGTALTIYASVLGSIQKHTLFSGQPGTNWQPVSVNYTGQGQIQFTVVGMFGAVPEPAVAVDAISITPCGESFPRCDFENDAHPFCDWTQTLGNDGQWVRGSKNMTTQDTGTTGVPLKTDGHFIYLEAKPSQAGQSFRLMSRPFCAPDAICVELTYYMNGLGNGTDLRLLLKSPAGSSPESLWHCTGSQSPDWLNTSITIPAGHQQPMQLILEATRGSNTTFVVAVGIISVNHGTCHGLMPTVLPPSQSPVSPTGLSAIPVSTEKPMTSTSIPSETSVTITQKSKFPVTGPSENLTIPIGVHTSPTTEHTPLPGEQATHQPVQQTLPTGEQLHPPEQSTHTPGTQPLPPGEQTPQCSEQPHLPEQPIHSPGAQPLPPEQQAPQHPGEQPHPPEQPVPSPGVQPLPPGEQAPQIPGEQPHPPEQPVHTPGVQPLPPGEQAPQSPGEQPHPPVQPLPPGEQCPQSPGEPAHLPEQPQSIHTPGAQPLPTGQQAPQHPGEQPHPPEQPVHPPGVQPLPPGEQAPQSPGEQPHPPEQPVHSPGVQPLPPGEQCPQSPGEPAHLPEQPQPIHTPGAQPLPTGQQAPQHPGEHPQPEQPVNPSGVQPLPPREQAPQNPGEQPHPPEQPIHTPEVQPFPPGEQAPQNPGELSQPFPSGQQCPQGPGEPAHLPEQFDYPSGAQPHPYGEQASQNPGDLPYPELPVYPPGVQPFPTGEHAYPIENSTVSPPGHSEKTPEMTTVLTQKTTFPTVKSSTPTEMTTTITQKTTFPTEKPTTSTETTTIPTEKPTKILIKRPTVPTVPNAKSTMAIQSPMDTAGASTTPKTPSTSLTTTTPSVTCPPDAHYEACACPGSCSNPKPKCWSVCHPGCVCNLGFLFSGSICVKASSCTCLYNNNYYQIGAAWFSPKCEERCHCLPGGQKECKAFRCGKNTSCGMKNGQYGCHPYGSATCIVYGDLHYLTFDGRPFSFMGKCTYILSQPCDNSKEPFFRVTGKKEEGVVEGVSNLNKVHVTLYKTTITLLKGRHTLVGGKETTLPVMLSRGIHVALSGRFVELQTTFGLRVRWDGEQQLYISVPSTYSSTLCGLCGNYDGNGYNDNLKPDGTSAKNQEDLGNSWQMLDNEDKECQRKGENPPYCDSTLLNSLSKPEMCGQLVAAHGAFEACLPHIPASPFFDNCMFDTCNFQGLRHMLCSHLSALTETCQEAGYVVKPWRGPKFCPMVCPPNSKYTLCGSLCPRTCHPRFFGISCQERCVEGCECEPGYVLSGFRCVPRVHCGCLDHTEGYFEIGKSWYRPGCTKICVCENYDHIRCFWTKCQPQEVCTLQNGIYGCHAQSSATCTISGDPHYQTFDGALHHFMGSCTYILTRPCEAKYLENNFIVYATNEFHDGNAEATYVAAVHVHIFNLKISLIRGHKVTLDGLRVTLPVWPAQGRLVIKPSGSFILLHTDFGLQIRYDGKHLVEVTVPSTYVGRLCGLCGNYNNISSDDSLQPDGKLASNALILGAAWMSAELSDEMCFTTGVGGRPSKCLKKEETDPWIKNCDILMSSQGPFSQCHRVVSPSASFSSCKYGQCGSKGSTLTLCRSLQAYASQCALAGHTLAWRNSTFCPMRCPPGSTYSTCANPCPITCLNLNAPKDCPPALPCVEGCECQKGHVLSGTSCVPLSHCGCTDPWGNYHAVGETWYTDKTCSSICTCSTYNNISCLQTSCKQNHTCSPMDGRMRCMKSGAGTCYLSEEPYYVSFDGSRHGLGSNCTYVLMKTCHFNRRLNYFKVTGSNEKSDRPSVPFSLNQVDMYIYRTRITLERAQRVLINGTQVKLPALNQIRYVGITASGNFTVIKVALGITVQFDGHRLQMVIPAAYRKYVCGLCGNFNAEEEDELMMPNDDLARDDMEFVDSWLDKETEPNCQPKDLTEEKKPEIICRLADLSRVQEQCQAALQAPAWATCATHVVLEPFLLDCIHHLCQFGGLHRALCESLQSYEAACRAQGLKPPIWRNSSFCPLECPIHSGYTTCLPACLPSCLDPDGQCNVSKGSSTCEEGCLCQPGFVLNEKQCVPRSQCGCKDPKLGFITAGKTWITNQCTQSCVCRAGVIQCQPFTCPSGTYCKTQSNGLQNCEAITLLCPANSSYTDCLPSCLPSCWDQDGQCKGSQAPSTCKAGCRCWPGFLLSEEKCVPRSQCDCKDPKFGTMAAGKTWFINKCTQKCVCTEGAIQCQPFTCYSGHYCKIPPTGPESCEPIPLQCPANSSYTACMPSCILSCGDPDNKCFGSQAPSTCQEGCLCQPGFFLSGKQCVSKNLCGCKDPQLGDIPAGKTWLSGSCTQDCECKAGAFQCRPFACASGSRCKTTPTGQEICEPIPLQCPVNSNYTACMPSCLLSCGDPDNKCDSSKAPASCREGCLCRPGFVLSEKQCVSKSLCGCKDSLLGYMPAGKTWFTSHCTKTCLCAAGVIQCRPFTCPTGTQCQINASGPDKCAPIPLKCPVHSSYTACMPSCVLSCGDPENKCDSSQAPSTCQEGCLCRPGFFLSGKQCVSKSQCGCKDPQLGPIIPGKIWFTKGCTQKCVCTEGTIQCQPYTCPSENYCKTFPHGQESCAPIPLKCPAHSNYTDCMPSCILMCGDRYDKCEGSQAPSTCQGGCLCHPGFVRIEKQCVDKFFCDCRNVGRGDTPREKSFLTSRCTTRCYCTEGAIKCQPFTCPSDKYCKIYSSGLGICEAAPQKCPRNSVYTDCMPSCVPSCGDPDDTCDARKAPAICQGGCLCRPGYQRLDKQCVDKYLCDCRNVGRGDTPKEKSFVTGNCTTRCFCTAGTLQCEPFTCPRDTRCQSSASGLDICAPIPRKCPPNSVYTDCMPSCVPSCGEPDNTCNASKAPSTCQGGCLCRKGFQHFEDQCVHKYLCDCKSVGGGDTPSEKSFLANNCTTRCFCAAETLQCEPLNCTADTHCQISPIGLEICAPIRLKCPANSKYQACMPSCVLSCGDPENKCNGSRAPTTCQKGCLCRPGFFLSGKQCVSKSQCGCKDPQLGPIIPGKIWFTKGCTQKCVCTEGAIQCQPYTCPPGTLCQTHPPGPESCEPMRRSFILRTCPAHSSYTSCMPSCVLSCGDREDKCKGSKVPSTCRRGCVCHPGFMLRGKQCVPKSQCGCKDRLLGLVPIGKIWLSSHCTKRCFCATGSVQCLHFTCPTGTQCLVNTTGPDKCGPIPLQCPAHSTYTACMPSCLLSCGDPDNKCDSSKAPVSCREGCLCRPGFVLSEKQCVSKSLCGCKDTLLGYMPAGKTWLSGRCTQDCECKAGAIQCQPFTCPTGTQCLVKAGAPDKCGPIPLLCPEGSNYTACMPSCLLSCGDRDDKCLGSPAPASCREGCLCQPGLVLSGNRCVRKNQCSCKDSLLGFMPAGETWYIKRCTKRCSCKAGFVDCQSFSCPIGTRCQLNSRGWERCDSAGPQCPANSIYTTCLPPCLATCKDPEATCKGMRTLGVAAHFTCREGCLCEPGFLLYDRACVPKGNCSCRDFLGPIPEGKIWFSSGCTQRCICKSGASQCHPFKCPSGFRCRSNSNGGGNCVPTVKRVLRMVKQEAGPSGSNAESVQCSVFGYLHYFTFDGASYSFAGRMTYTLVTTVDVLPGRLQPLAVEGRNRANLPRTSPLLHEVIVKVYGYTVQLQGKLQLVVNNQRMAIPYKPSEHLRVTVRGLRLYLITDFELVVSFDGINSAVISLPGTYKGLVHGLCGNFDKNMTNEFIMPSGTLTQNINIFGNSWEVKKNQKELVRFSRVIREEEKEEKGRKSDSHASECRTEQLAHINSTQGCTVLVDPQGPFATCHQKLAPESFREYCVLDMCSTWDPKEQEKLRCKALSVYAIICQEAGITLVNWRNHTDCALACPANTVYQSCMTPCPASCANLEAPKDCEGPCVEGCASLPGYIYSGVQSLSPARCGCTNNGIYYQQGDSFVTEDCTQRCTCANPEVLQCEPHSCSAGEICTLGNLTRGCFQDSPCLENPCQNDGQCQEQGDYFTCECELGYGGDFCMEPQEIPLPAKPDIYELVVTMLGLLVMPAVVLVLISVMGEYKKRMQRAHKEKMQSKNRDRLVDSDSAPESVFIHD